MSASANLFLSLQLRPSIFEITASELIDGTIQNALRNVLHFLRLKVSSYDGYTDEWCLGISSILQALYFWKKNASFGESFYGLQRCGMNVKELSKKQKLLSLMSVVLKPYMEYKCKYLSDYPILKAYYIFSGVSECLKILHTIGYLAEVTSTHSPLMRWLQVCYDYAHPLSKEEKFFTFVINTLEILAFCMEFTKWWGVNSTVRSFNVTKPKALAKKIHSSYLCPICLQTPTIPTANSVSGYVFCYKCITNHLQSKKLCPITNYAFDFSDLIRIYETNK